MIIQRMAEPSPAGPLPKHEATFSFPARNDALPWRVLNVESNSYVWLRGELARYPDEAAAKIAAAALDALERARDPVVRLAALERATRRRTFVQLGLAAVLIPVLIVAVLAGVHFAGVQFAHAQHAIQSLPL